MRHQLAKLASQSAPKLLRYPLAIVPFSVQMPLLERFVTPVFAEHLEEGEMDFLEGRWLQVDVTDIGYRFQVTVDDEALVFRAAKEEADVTFSATMNDLILVAARKQDPDTLFFQRRLVIDGDTGLGLAVKNLIDSIEWDKLPSWMGFMLQQTANVIEEGAATQADAPTKPC